MSTHTQVVDQVVLDVIRDHANGILQQIASIPLPQPKDIAPHQTPAETSPSVDTASSPLAPVIPKATASIATSIPPMAWGAKVSPEFRRRVHWICTDPEMGLGINPHDLMSCMAWESGRTFSPSVKNAAGSGATGLIQFMPKTAVGLGTTTAELAKMTAEDQLNYVWKYFAPWDNQLKTLSDLYMAILWPKGVGQPEEYDLWTQGGMPKTYAQNKGLDINRDGVITKAECSAKLYAMKAEGMKPGNIA